MNSLYRNLFVIFSFITLITACSSQISVDDVTDNKVVISAPPEKFTEAYDMAKRECQKNTKIAQYITDETSDLNEVAFNCISAEELAAAEAAETQTDEVESGTGLEPQLDTEEESTE
ncbi:MAG TPA: hypothetical protein EYQ42_02460 [Thiotrichaceae bacterium]|jgi:hypothetical protein|nr:hypothetical protein [Thiotrichaceae bacterium]HIL86250.1 hypothetical protein [Candidatus Neomarinimicrobiota bacterium]